MVYTKLVQLFFHISDNYVFYPCNLYCKMVHNKHIPLLVSKPSTINELFYNKLTKLILFLNLFRKLIYLPFLLNNFHKKIFKDI